MTSSQALASILSSVAVILALFVQSWVSAKFDAKQAAQITAKVDQVHEVVNGNHEAALARIDQLGDALSQAGVAVPPHPPVPPGTPAPQPEGA
jgi:hypothetical protein